MAKTEYDIDGRQFHIERCGKSWCGWFTDAPDVTFTDLLKHDLLRKVGYRSPHLSGVRIVITPDYIYTEDLGRGRTMQNSFDEFRNRLSNGILPKFSKDNVLSKFVIFARDKCQCYYCGVIPDQSNEIHLDHVIPYSQGGGETASNLVVACYRCNSRKRDRRLKNEEAILAEIQSRNRQMGIGDHQLVGMIERPALEGSDSSADPSLQSQRKKVIPRTETTAE